MEITSNTRKTAVLVTVATFLVLYLGVFGWLRKIQCHPVETRNGDLRLFLPYQMEPVIPLLNVIYYPFLKSEGLISHRGGFFYPKVRIRVRP